MAYKNGETSVKISASRKHYVIHFNTMLQENEETLHKRPVMLAFEKPVVIPPTTATTTAGTESSTTSSTTATTITAAIESATNAVTKILNLKC